MKQKNMEQVTFYLCSLILEPYKEYENTHNSYDILKRILAYLHKQKKDGKGVLIDRFENRNGDERRELFMNSLVYVHKEKKIRCSIALLRTGRVPKLKPKSKYELIDFNDLGTPAEETNFYIDYSGINPVFCVEYNHYGPRIKDIEYYFRNIGKNILNLSKKTSIEIFMNNNISETLDELKNVLNFEIKVDPKDLDNLDKNLREKYFTHINHLSSYLKPRYIKIEALFQTPGQKYDSKSLNSNANSMIKDLLNAFSGRPFNIDVFDNFVVKYEDKNGEEQFFDLLKNKVNIQVEFDFKNKKKDLFYLVLPEFDQFIRNRNK